MSDDMVTNVTGFAYLVASVFFILALRGLSSPESARRGNFFGVTGMVIAVATTLFDSNIVGYSMIILGVLIGGTIGTVVAWKIQMTALPQLVAAFHSLVGMAAVLVASAALHTPGAYGIGLVGAIAPATLIEMTAGTAVGAATFSGSIIAFLKLQGLMTSAPLTFPGQRQFHALLGLVLLGLSAWFVGSESYTAFWALTLLAFVLGFLMILPIGGADMPVVVSMLNSLSGWAACGIGFTLGNASLIVTGALVGSSGAILSYIMCKGMNRSFVSVIMGGFGGEGGVVAKRGGEERPVKAGNADDAAFILSNAGSVIIVPGYGMAVAQAQHALKEMCDLLEKSGARVRYAIHPVAGRMPGHMNVLLAEANVPYDQVLEMDEINHEFANTDVTFVIGANDITNPAAHTDPSSPIYGMPILDVEKSGMVLFVKRSLGVGYAGVDNELFYRDNTMMLFGDAKAMCEHIIRAVP